MRFGGKLKWGAVTVGGLVVVVALAAATYVPTPAGALSDGPWEPGAVKVRGKVASTGPWNQSGETLTGVTIDLSLLDKARLATGAPVLDCDSGTVPTLITPGDPRIGSRWTTTIHFEAFTLDGQPAVSAKEATCPFPMLHMAMFEVLDAVSWVLGYRLAWDGEVEGWHEFVAWSNDGGSYALEDVQVALSKNERDGPRIDSVQDWIRIAEVDFILASDGGYAPHPVEVLDSASVQGERIRIIDVDGDGRFGHEDRVSVRFPDASAETYMLRLRLCEDDDCIIAAKPLLVRDGTPLVWPEATRSVFAPLAYEGPSVEEPGVTWFRAVASPGAAPALTDVTWRLMTDWRVLIEGTAANAGGAGNVTLSTFDEDGDGKLSAGDRIRVAAWPGAQLQLRMVHEPTNMIVAQADWITGGPKIPDHEPRIAFAVEAGTATLDVDWQDPVLALPWAEVVVQRERNVLRDAPVSERVAFDDGAVHFDDVDGDGHLSSGDTLHIEASPGLYQITLRIPGSEHTVQIAV